MNEKIQGRICIYNKYTQLCTINIVQGCLIRYKDMSLGVVLDFFVLKPKADAIMTETILWTRITLFVI